ncbi:MAG TPA: diguanylate cyclase, partial [Acidimicrobiales bacterium]|nr:diguanylate cyclase [Acidimicrobiales bacterium]
IAIGGQVVDEAGVPIDPSRFPVEISMRSGLPLRGVTLGHVFPDGRTQWLSFSTEVLEVGPSVDIHAVVVSFEDVTTRREALLAEQAQRRRDRTVLDALSEGVLMFDGDGRVLTSNSAVEGLFHVVAEWLEGRTYQEMMDLLEVAGGTVHDENDEPFPLETHPAMRSRLSGETVAGFVLRITLPGEEERWFQVHSRPLVSLALGPPFPVVVSFADVTDMKRAELERAHLLSLLRRERQFLTAVLGNVDEGIIACDAEGRVTVFNETMRLFLQLGPGEEIVGAPLSVPGIRRASDGRPLKPDDNPLALALAGARVSNVEYVIEPPQGLRRIVLASGQALRAPDGEGLGAVVAFHDVTDQRRFESELSDLALHDPLTRLANRILLSDRLEVAFERSAREGAGVGVMLLDLDDFKLVNDSLGHAAGDEVLVTTAARLRGAVRPGDTVARLGGDEFVVVCPHIDDEQELAIVGERLARAVAQPQLAAGREVVVTASIGQAHGTPGKESPDTLLQRADDAMYRMKDQRRGTRAAGRGS